jgi:hypothetical protein
MKKVLKEGSAVVFMKAHPEVLEPLVIRTNVLYNRGVLKRIPS